MSYLDDIFSLTGKTALVTGAARGMGIAMTEGLLRAGASVILVGSKPDPLREAAEAYRKDGLDAIDMPCDLEDREQIQALLDRVAQEVERLDILVNVAGITFPADSLDYDMADWDKTVRINLDAPFILSKGVARLMKEHGGSIINVTSVCAEIAFPNNPAYAATKGALKMLTKSLAVDFAPHGIRVNTIGPGYIAVGMTYQSYLDPEKREQRASHTMTGRWGDPRELVGTVLLLASDASTYITGQDIYVDGGWIAKGM